MVMDEHTIENERAFRAFVPSKLELIILPIASLLFLTVTNSVGLLRSVDGQNYLLVVDYMQARLKDALSAIDRIVGFTIPLVVFWMFIGVIAYLLLWLALGAYNAYRTDVPQVKGMVVPNGYNRSKIFHESLVRFFTRALAAGTLILSCICSGQHYCCQFGYLSSHC